jgi:hypothetical protein
MQRRSATLSGSIAFLRTELETALTFTFIAEQAHNEEKINRNLGNARKALQTARHFMERTSLSDPESSEFHEKVRLLELRIRKLEAHLESCPEL